MKAHISRYERLVGSTALKNDVIEIRGLKIDKTDRRVYVDNEEKVFTNKEFDILCFLASNPNKVFSKDELFSKIWNMDSIGDIGYCSYQEDKGEDRVRYLKSTVYRDCMGCWLQIQNVIRKPQTANMQRSCLHETLHVHRMGRYS